jgi:CheY-like chemotaxis protein
MQTIMIVDDEPSIVDIFGLMLERKGYQTVPVHSGEECIQILQALQPDMILLDINMPSMDGWETLKQIRSNLHTQSIPVIMVTGIQLTPEETVKYGNLMDDYITKPTSINELVGHIETVFQKRKELDEEIEQALKKGIDEKTIAEIKRLTHNRETSDNLLRVLERGYKSSGTKESEPEYGSGSVPLTFISAKSADYDYARTLNAFLKKKGIPTFFSDESIDALGQANYRKIIDTMLEQAGHLVVVASRPEYVSEGWVEYEWGSFVNLQRAGKKQGGNLVILTVGSLNPADLPLSLQYNQVIPFTEENFGKLLHYLA